MPSRKTRSNRAQRRRGADADVGADVGAWASRLRSLLQRLGWGAREAVAVMVGGCAAVAVIVNALFLQSGPHPAPFFNSPPPLDVPAETTSVAVAVPRARPPDPPAPPPRAETLPAKRVIAMQRALAQFGYGQIRPTGVVDSETRAAIEKFERDHRLPITGQVTERLAREIAAMTGRSVE